MSKPKNRRILLSVLAASGMLTSGAGTGYWIYSSGDSTQAQAELEAGFESAQASDTLTGMTEAWNRQPDSNVKQVVAEVSVESPPVSDEMPELPQTDLAGLDSLQLPPMSELPPLDSPADAQLAETKPVELAEEPRSADEVVARGQTPFGELPPIEPLPAGNPLRNVSAALPDVESVAESSSEAAEAFEGAMPLPEPSIDSMPIEAPPEPIDMQGGNPLRDAAPPIESSSSAPIPMPGGFDAAPLEAAPLPRSMSADAPVEMPAEIPQPAPFEQPEPARVASSTPNAFDQLPSTDAMALEPTPAGDLNTATLPSSMVEGTGRPGEGALEGAQRPSLMLQKFAPQEIQVGKECKFVIKVRNVGQRPADDVVVEDVLPHGTQYLGANPHAENLGDKLAWKIGTLSPGEERTLEVELMPIEEGEIGSVAKVTFASHASAKSRCTKPQLAIRMSAPEQVLIGRQQRINIEIHNPGTGDATNVMLLENVPENVRHQAGPALEFEVGTLRAGETRRMELVLTAEKPGRVVNLLTARADGNLQVQQEVEFEVISPALAVKVDGPKRRYLERPATYTVSIDNPGTAPAKDVQLVTKLPRGMKFVRANNLGEYDAATHSIYWSLAELPKGQKGSVELVALPVQSGDHTIEVQGRAREGLEDRTTQPVRIEGLAAIMFEVRDTQDPIEVGGTTSYQVRVVNQGSKAATNVQVTAQVPPGMAVTSAQGETRHAVRPEGVIFEPIARLAPKAEVTFRIDVQGIRPGDQRLAVEVRTDDIPQPIRKEESTRVFGDE